MQLLFLIIITIHMHIKNNAGYFLLPWTQMLIHSLFSGKVPTQWRVSTRPQNNLVGPYHLH